ncbi:MAG: ATP-binding protein [Actinomycetota bacterium]
MELQRAILAQDPNLDLALSAPKTARAVSPTPTGVVTFLLTDIEGSSETWERDQQAMSQALERHDALIEAFVGAGGGVLVKEKGEGDATLAVFRRATEAVSTAIDLQAAFRDERWPSGIRLQVRMAIHTGEAHERDGDYYGPTVNRAARLRSLARGGQVVLSQATAELVRDHVPPGLALQDLGTHELKGLARGERVFELAPQASSQETQANFERPPLPRALETVSGSVFVGRDEELVRLAMLWKAAVAGHRRIGFVAGEPGIGKTRLASEFANRVHAEGAIVLFGRCDEDLGMPYQPFAEALRDLVATCPTSLLSSELGGKLSDLHRLHPEIAERVPNASRTPTGEPEEERYRLFDATLAMLQLAARRAPVLLVVDDVQWAAKPSLLLLRHIVRSSEDFGILIVATYRDTELDRQHPLAEILSDLRRVPGDFERIPLRGLDAESVESYVSEASGQTLDDNEIELARLLHAETDGNPFFLGEMIRHLVERGAIYREEGRWHTKLTPETEGLPEGIRDVITRRLSRLTEPTNRALALASVIGPTFSLRVLEAATESPDDRRTLIDSIEHAAQAGLIMENTSGTYTFAHALVRQTLYSELSSVRRMRLHRRVGEALEQLPETREQLPALAHHFAEAALDGVAAKAADYAIQASQQALERLAHEEAVERLERALVALETGAPDDTERRIEVLLALARAKETISDVDGARAPALAAAGLARASRSSEALARAAVIQARIGPLGLPDPDTAEVCQEALELLPQDNSALRALVLAGLARSRAYTDTAKQTSAAELAEQAIEIARASGDVNALSAVMSMAGFALLGSERVSEREAIADELIQISASTNDFLNLGDGYSERAIIRIQRGNKPGFDDDVASLNKLADEQRSKRLQALAIALRCQQAFLEGRLREGHELSDAMMNAGGQDPNVVTFRLGHEAVWRLECDPPAENVAYMSAVIAQRPRLSAVRAILGRLLAEVGEKEKGREEIHGVAENDLQGLPHDAVRNTGLAWLAEAANVLGDEATAVVVSKHLKVFSGQLVVVGRSFVYGAADRCLAMCATTLKQWSEAERLFLAALELEERVNAPAIVARTRWWYARMLLERNAEGDRKHASELLASSFETAIELGMTRLVDDARALMRPEYPRLIAWRDSSIFVGRDSETERLHSLWGEAKAGTTRTALIAGEPGIGKTWLASEIAQHAYRDGAVVLYGRCEEDLGVPYQPFVEALRAYLDAYPSDAIRADAGQGLIDLALLMPDLAQRFTDLPTPTRTDAESERLRLFEAMADLFAAITKHSPVLLVLDDLQWAAKPTLLMLRHLLRAHTDSRLLIVGVYRDTDLARTHPLAEMLADLRKETETARIPLTGLAKKDVASFIAAASGHPLDEQGQDLADALYAETEGNPFFMTEVMRHLVETGLVFEEKGRWITRVATTGELGLPEGVREVISRRLSRLSEPINRTLAVAAVVGPIFSSRVLEAIPEAAGNPTSIIDSLEEAERARLIVEEGPGAFRFTHALIRQTLLEELSSTKRARLHGRVAVAIEQQPDHDQQVEALAFHFAEAAMDGHAAKAVEFAEAAARRANERLAYEEGATYLERGLAALELINAADEKRADLLLSLAEIKQSLGDSPGARETALQAAAAARKSGSAEQLARCAILLTRQGALGLPDPEAGKLSEEALAALPEESVALRALVMAGLARYRVWDESAREPAEQLARQALELARASGDPHALSAVLGIVLFTLYGPERVDELAGFSDELIELAAITHDSPSRSDALAARALARCARGDRAGFDSDLLELTNYATHERLRLKLAIATSLRVIQACIAGSFDEAEATSAHMMELAGHDPNIFNLNIGHRIIFARERGQEDQFLPTIAAIVEARPGLAGPFVALGALFHAQVGNRESSLGALQRLASDDLTSLPRDATWGSAMCFLAESAARLDAPQFVPLLQRSLRTYGGQVTFIGRAFAWGSADRFLGMLAATAGDLSAAEEHYKAALELEERLEAPPFLARTRWWYARMLLTRNEQGDRERALEMLDQTIATASELGMNRLLSEAQELRGSA